jgi:single-strand DNA-binding protein
MNSVAVTGRLTADPVMKRADTQEVTRFRIAIDNGPNPATYVDCEAWGRLGTAVATHLRKARLVAVSGTLRQAEWTDAEGQRHERHYVTAASVDFLDRPAEIQSAPAAA